MFNQPLTAAGQRWEKAFKRMYLLLKYYPLEYFDKNLRLNSPEKEIQVYINKILNGFLLDEDARKSCLLSGLNAYNFYIKHAMQDSSVEKMARTYYKINNMSSLLSEIPYVEIISVSYAETVEKIYNFLKKEVIDPKNLNLEEYFPFFQFTNYSVIIKYRDQPIVKIYEADGYCIPYVKTNKEYMYVSYQYLLMMLLISKFRYHVEKNKDMYFAYSIAISNLVASRNIFLTKKNLGVINNTVFSEFRINCVGTTLSYMRESLLRRSEKSKMGYKSFRYEPEKFFLSSQESQERFNPGKITFRNTSGNKIINPKNLLFRIDDDGNLVKNIGNIDDSIREGEETEDLNKN
jgi:hypothetical protein